MVITATMAIKIMASLVITHTVFLLQIGSLKKWRICLMSSMVEITTMAQEGTMDRDIMDLIDMAITG